MQPCSSGSKLHPLVTFNKIFFLQSLPYTTSSYELASFSFGGRWDYIQDGCRRGLEVLVDSFPRARNKGRQVRCSMQSLWGCQKFSHPEAWCFYTFFLKIKINVKNPQWTKYQNLKDRMSKQSLTKAYWSLRQEESSVLLILYPRQLPPLSPNLAFPILWVLYVFLLLD